MTSAAPPVVVEWHAPEGCPQASEVETAVAQLVGDRSAAAPEVAVRGAVERADGRYRATLDLEVDGSRSQRTLAASTCALVSDAAAVVIATLFPEPSAPAPAAPEPPPPSNATRPFRAIALGIGGFVDSATLPSWAPGVVLSGTWSSSRRFAVRVEAGVTASSHADGRTTVDGRELGADTRLWRGSARADYAFGEATAIGGSGGIDGGVIHARGTGLLVSRSTDVTWFALDVGPFVRKRVGERLGFRAEADLLVPLVRPSIESDGEVRHRPAPAGVRFGLSAEIGF